MRTVHLTYLLLQIISSDTLTLCQTYWRNVIYSLESKCPSSSSTAYDGINEADGKKKYSSFGSWRAGSSAAAPSPRFHKNRLLTEQQAVNGKSSGLFFPLFFTGTVGNKLATWGEFLLSVSKLNILFGGSCSWLSLWKQSEQCPFNVLFYQHKMWSQRGRMWQRGGTVAHVRCSRVTSGSANVLAKPAGGI